MRCRHIVNLRRCFLVAIALVLGILCSSTAQSQDSLQRTTLDPFGISFGPLTRELSYDQQLLVRYEVERVLSTYLKTVFSEEFVTNVIFVAVPTILSYSATDDNGASMILDGVLYYSDTSTIIPSPSDILPMMEDALDEDVIIPALQKHFSSVSMFSFEESATFPPTNAPTLTTFKPTNTPTSVPHDLTVPPTFSSTTNPTMSPTAVPSLPLTNIPTDDSSGSNVEHSSSSPSWYPTLVPVTTDPVSTTSPPQSVDGVLREINSAIEKDSTSPGTIVVAATCSMLVLFLIVILNSRRRPSRQSNLMAHMDEDSVMYEEGSSEDHADEETSVKKLPVGTHADSSKDKADVVLPVQDPCGHSVEEQPVNLKKHGGLRVSLFRVTKRKPPIEVASDSPKHEDEQHEEIFRHPWTQHPSPPDRQIGFAPRDQSPITIPDSISGQSVSTQSMESFEVERREHESSFIRKDMLESSHFSFHNVRQAWDLEAEYDCALTPTDSSAFALANHTNSIPVTNKTTTSETIRVLKPTGQGEDDNDTLESQVTLEDSRFQEELRHQTQILRNDLTGYVASVLGWPQQQPERRRRRRRRSPRKPSELRGVDFIGAASDDDDDSHDSVGSWDPNNDEERYDSLKEKFSASRKQSKDPSSQTLEDPPNSGRLGLKPVPRWPSTVSAEDIFSDGEQSI